MSKLEALSIALSVTCEACRLPVPVNGLVERLGCPSCSRELLLPTAWWVDFFDGSTIARAMQVEEDQSHPVATLGSRPTQATLGRDPPPCPQCAAPLPIEAQALVQAAEQGWLGCACGSGLPIRPAPPLRRVLLVGARYVVGEQPALPVISAFHLLAELSDEDWMRILAEDPELVGGLASSEALPSDLLLRFAHAEDWQLRRAVSRNPHLAADLQAQLARDPDSEVRRALAGRETLAPDVLRRLVADTDDEVRSVIAARPALVPALQQRLAGDVSWRVRAALVQSPAIQDEILSEIARREDDAEVLKVLAARDPLPGAALPPEAHRDRTRRQRRMLISAALLIGIALCGGLITALVGLAMVASRFI